MQRVLVVALLFAYSAHALCTQGKQGDAGPTPAIFSTQDGQCALFVGSNQNVTVCHIDVDADRRDQTLELNSVDPYSVAIFNGTRFLKSVNLTDGQVLIGSTGAAAVPSQLLGTPKQVTVTSASGSITLSGPQNIDATATPTFAGLTLSGVSANGSLYTSNGKVVSSSHMLDGQILIGANVDVPVAANILGTANQVTVTNAKNSITLSGPQDLAVTSSPSFASGSFTGATNQLILGTTRTITLSAPIPASSSRIVTLPDPGAAANVLYDVSAQTVTGAKTLTQPLTITATAGQLVLSGPTRTTTISAVQPASSSRTVTLQDPGADCDFVVTTGAQTIAGIKTMSDATDAASSTSAGFVVSGGFAVAKKVYVGTGIFLPTTGGTASQLDTYTEISQTLSLGGAVSTTVVAKFVRVGAEVTMNYRSVSVSTVPQGAIRSITTAFASIFFPAVTLTMPVIVTSNAVNALGSVDVRSDGFLIWYVDAVGNNFTASTANCGFPAGSLRWTVL